MRFASRIVKMISLRWFQRPTADHLIAERAVALSVWKDAQSRRDTRAMNAAQARAYMATVMELQATVRGRG